MVYESVIEEAIIVMLVLHNVLYQKIIFKKQILEFMKKYCWKNF